ncbi:hypothetical protein LSH36_773g00011 [Paralvinella palmiformis]|uniref:Uncharacterized protein n=1 Tax=Paralvinella palmiformis TaxID=53620 RepID=A0AAD9J1J6_9ANNE|nr:hypothetical protein LSH36_773g00011 [Paralvinella palmiformis]
MACLLYSSQCRGRILKRSCRNVDWSPLRRVHDVDRTDFVNVTSYIQDLVSGRNATPGTTVSVAKENVNRLISGNSRKGCIRCQRSSQFDLWLPGHKLGQQRARSVTGYKLDQRRARSVTTGHKLGQRRARSVTGHKLGQRRARSVTTGHKLGQRRARSVTTGHKLSQRRARSVTGHKLGQQRARECSPLYSCLSVVGDWSQSSDSPQQSSANQNTVSRRVNLSQLLAEI